MPFLRRFASPYTLFLLAGFLVWALMSASSASADSTAAIAQGFQTTEKNLAAGAVVSLKPGSPNTIELSNTERVNQMVGVVGDKPLLELSDNNLQQVQVVTNGITATLVSDINGDIKTGDKITASPISGVGMKATKSSQVVGTAQADLSSVTTKSQPLNDTSGATQTVRVGTVPVQVAVAFYQPIESASILPAFLQNFANSVAGKDVAVVRVVLAAIILMLAFVSIAVLLYSAVKSSIISIGRNPLSEVAVRKGLLQVGFTIIGILLITLITIYLILIT